MGDKLKPKAKAASPEKARRDAILIHGVSEDGESMAVLRARDDRLEAGVLRTVKAGKPIEGELLKLTPRPEFPLVCDVEVQLPAGTINAAGGSDQAQDPAAREGLGRPAQVATESYRENWDAIWRKPGKKALAN
jgi:uncharacterized small protein (DUF1192 family)